MNAIASAPVAAASSSLPALIDRAVSALTNARSAAEVLEARDLASVAYDIAKTTARLLKAKRAHDDLIAAAYRAKADALEIEAAANRRLADEYDAAQERGEVQRAGGDRTTSIIPDENNAPTIKDIGLTSKAIHEARVIRDAERAEPGVVRRVVEEALAAGEEPTRAKLKRATLAVVGISQSQRPSQGRAAICGQVSQCVLALAGFPPAAEVARYFDGADSATIINERIEQAAVWLAEFRTAWGDRK